MHLRPRTPAAATTHRCGTFLPIVFFLLLEGTLPAQQVDLLLRGGHVINPQTQLSAERDVAIAAGRIVAVAEEIDPATALMSIDVTGLYVTPGLIDMHVHVFAGTGERKSYAGDYSVYPDGFTLRRGVTTVVDAGSAGWANFEMFKDRVIDRSKTRVLAFLNIIGGGMRGLRREQNLAEMQVAPAVAMGRRHRGLIVGIKTAHYMGAEFTPVERAVEAGSQLGIPVMVDFGRAYPEKSLRELLSQKLRAGDIYTHMYSGLRDELLPPGIANPALRVARERGVLLDVGHGGGSFAWRVAVPIVEEGILPDTISTDLHTGSMNAGMKDLLNVMSKFLALGMSLEAVVERATWQPARAIGREDLGRLAIDAPADLAVLRLEEGNFGFLDSYGARLDGNQRLQCEMTIRAGRVVYELNGLSRPHWTALPRGYRNTGSPRWDGTIRPRASRQFRSGDRRPKESENQP